MSFELLVAPPGGGKTTRLLERARGLTAAGKRVWWVGLPSQRAALYRRATEEGAVLGLEFLTSQQVYYRLLAHALRLKPLLAGTGRLALVGEALREVRGDLPNPGEARLFAQAIAEAKRYGLSPEALRGDDPEVVRFREVFAAYEEHKGERWDYDDFRTRALALAEEGAAEPEADAVLVDGFRELGPLEFRLLRHLGRRTEVVVALPEAPPGEEPSETLPPRPVTAPQAFLAANPVAESRWVLRALKRDLAAGLDPLDLAVILPEGETTAFAALADEYGVPVMDETPKALADTLPGRLLLDLLELPDYPTASRLLAIPELAPLARAALDAGVAGFEPIEALARREGLEPLWRAWRARLEVTGGELAWAEALVDGLPAAHPELEERSGLPFARFREHALQRAQEAAGLARGAPFRAWWAALLHETQLFERPRGGVALLGAKLASGRRFRRAYLMRAVEGAYTAGESEDYFLPEEERAPLARVHALLREGAVGALPRRFQGRDRALVEELRCRADELTVTAPRADQGGPRVPDEALLGPCPLPLPELPIGSRLELAPGEPYRAAFGRVALGRATVQKLQRYDACPARLWAERATGNGEARPWWLELVSALREWGRLDPARMEELRGRHPEAAAWLAEHEAALAGLRFGVRLPDGEDGPHALVDAAERRGGEATLYRFVAPGRVSVQEEAEAVVKGRWNELWAAGHMLERYGGRVTRVFVAVWPVLGVPVHAFERGIDYEWRTIQHRRRRAEAAWKGFAAGEVHAKPGFACRECGVFDVCREGAR